MLIKKIQSLQIYLSLFVWNYLSIQPSVYLFIYQTSTCLSFYHTTISLFTHVSIYNLSIYTSVYLSIFYSFVNLSIYMSICLSINHSSILSTYNWTMYLSINLKESSSGILQYQIKSRLKKITNSDHGKKTKKRL